MPISPSYNTLAKLITISVLWILSGCAGHNVKYIAFVKNKFPPADRAISTSGSYEEAKIFFERALLPHNTTRRKCELRFRALRCLTDQLGSEDYILIGEVFGGGNAYANQATLTKVFCEKAAKNGGNVVMIFRRSTVQQPYSYTLPGYSITNTNASVYNHGNYATGYGSSQTTYTPSQTYSGVHYKPTANGLVFRHIPGAGANRKSLLELDDQSLERVLKYAEAVVQNKKLTWNEARKQIDSFVTSEKSR